MKRFLIPATLLGLCAFVACSSNPNSTIHTSNPVASSRKIVGTLNLSFEGIGDSNSGAKAQFIPSASLRSQASTFTGDAGLSFNRSSVSFVDVGDISSPNPIRYVQAVFRVCNSSPQAFDNLTMYAYNRAGVDIGGTSISNMVAGNGNPITSPGIPQGFRPGHGLNLERNRVRVAPSMANMQLFTPDEATDIQTAARGAGLSDFGPEDQVLETGFVATNQLLNRRLETGAPSATTCGFVTFSYALPLVFPRVDNPWSFRTRFVVANETASIYTQSLEEQQDDTVAGKSISSYSADVSFRVLPGSKLPEVDPRAAFFCRPRNGVTTVLNVTSGSPGKLDTCFYNAAIGDQVVLALSPDPADNGQDYLGDVIDSKPETTNGAIVAVGTSYVNSHANFSLAGIGEDGQADVNFGTSGPGKTFTLIGAESGAEAVAKTTYSGGKPGIAVAGWSQPTAGAAKDFAVGLYQPNGFSVGYGTTTVSIEDGNDFARTIHPQSDGSLIVTGESNTPPDINGDSIKKLAIIKLNPDGTLNSSFGNNGVVSTDAGFTATNISMQLERISSIGKSVQQTDGKIIMVAHKIGGFQENILCRFNIDGSFDTSFGTLVNHPGCIISESANGEGQLNAVAVQSNGKIIAVGGRQSDGSDKVQIGRWNANGTPDNSFNSAGGGYNWLRVLEDCPCAGSAYNLVIQPDGKIVIAGFKFSFFNTTGAALWLARLNSDGSSDSVFTQNASNIVKYVPPNPPINLIGFENHAAHPGLAIQSDGNILAAGTTTTGPSNYSDFRIVRVFK